MSDFKSVSLLPFVNSNSNSNAELAVLIRNGYQSFDNGRTPILKNFSMTVCKGTIYNLIGSSGCGKTTTLACIAGVRNLNHGKILVLGSEPNSRKGFPGKRMGYMPQDITLYGDFTIAETLSYFGSLCGMERKRIKKRVEYLCLLLNLTNFSHCQVANLSGGEQRRVSMAVALVHEPELLLLDEPTVGVDPLLRQSIWEHLEFLSATKQTTVILTTHYMSEAKRSNMIGIMKSGRLIAEDCPSALLQRFNTQSLEMVLLNIWKLQDLENVSSVVHCPPCSSANVADEGFKFSETRIVAVLYKNLTMLFRNWWLLIFMIVVPSITVFLTCISMKDGLNQLSFGIVNGELDMMNNTVDCLAIQQNQSLCDFENLGCNFINHLADDFILTTYKTGKEAERAVQKGEIWGFLSIPENYSTGVYERFGMEIDEETLNKSMIAVRMDQTNSFIYGRIAELLLLSFEKYGKELAKSCGHDERLAELPLQYKTPIVGENSMTVLDFIAPGISIGWLMFFPLLSTSIRYIGEKKKGLLERSFACGVKHWEIAVGYFVTEFVIIVMQSVLVYCILRMVFGVGVLSNPWLPISLFIMTGCSGMGFGFLLAVVCREEVQAAMLAIAIFFPNAFVSGSFWPKEGMPQILQVIVPFLPFTRPCETSRSVMVRGWEFSHPNVWPGYLTSGIYTTIYFLSAVAIHTYKSKKA